MLNEVRMAETICNKQTRIRRDLNLIYSIAAQGLLPIDKESDLDKPGASRKVIDKRVSYIADALAQERKARFNLETAWQQVDRTEKVNLVEIEMEARESPTPEPATPNKSVGKMQTPDATPSPKRSRRKEKGEKLQGAVIGDETSRGLMNHTGKDVDNAVRRNSTTPSAKPELNKNFEGV